MKSDRLGNQQGVQTASRGTPYMFFFFISQFIFKEILHCIVKQISMETQKGVADKDRMTQGMQKSSSPRL